MKLRQALHGCSTGQLARISTAVSFQAEAGTLRRELVELLADRIAAVASAPALWQALDADAAQVVRWLVQAGGRHEAELLLRRLTRGAANPDDARAKVERALAELVDRGLVYRLFDAEEQRRGLYYVLPDEVLEPAREHLGAGPSQRPPRLDAQPVRIAHGDLAHDLFALASALRREVWGAASRGLAGRRAQSVGQIVAGLRALAGDGPGDPGRRFRFLLWLGQRAGWMSRAALPVPDEVTIERLLHDPGRLPALALSAGPVEAGTEGRGTPDRANPRQRQADALQLLSELEGDGWWNARQVVTWLADELLGARERPGDMREDRERRQLEAQLGRWLVGRWFWLGTIDWGWDGSAWTLLAPTDGLRALATGQSGASTPRPEACRIVASHRIEAPRRANLPLLFRAERYLAYAGSDAEVRRYGLTAASFDRGARLGGDAEELESLLRRLLEDTLPHDWLGAIARWSSGEGRLTLSARLVLSSDRPDVLGEALATPAARAAVVETIAPEQAFVSGEHVATLLTELARAGLPVDIEAGLRAEPRDAGRAAALAHGVAETAWVALEVLRRLAPDVVAEQRDLQAARGQLDAVLPNGVLESLNRRATALAAAIANRRRPRARGRMV